MRGSRVTALLVLFVALAAGAASTAIPKLSPKERARLSQLVRDSRGRLGNLSVRERDEFRKLVRKLDLKRMGRELVPIVRGRRRRKRR